VPFYQINLWLMANTNKSNDSSSLWLQSTYYTQGTVCDTSDCNISNSTALSHGRNSFPVRKLEHWNIKPGSAEVVKQDLNLALLDSKAGALFSESLSLLVFSKIYFSFWFLFIFILFSKREGSRTGKIKMKNKRIWTVFILRIKFVLYTQ
jgi:hypothetical protein